MKIFRLTGLLFLMLSIIPLYGQNTKEIKGSGYVLTQQRNLNDFTSIEVSSGIDIAIVQGEILPITVEADDNLFPYLKTVVHNKILKVYIPDTIKITKYADLNVLISMPVLCDLRASNGSRIDASPQRWDCRQINLEATNGARIRIHLKTKNIQIAARTSATVELKGNSENLQAVLKTAARLEARNFRAETAHLNLATGARAEIQVTDSVSYELSGNAHLLLKGTPHISGESVNSGSKMIREK